MRTKVYFITDAHLGSGADSRQREQELCQFLDSIAEEVESLVLLGDLFDFWFSYHWVVPRGHVRLLGKLAQLSDQGVKIHYFIGNHDMWMFDYLEKEIGCTMYDDPAVLTFGDKRFLLGHGDGLGHLDRHYDFLRRIFRSRVNQCLFSLLPERLTFGIATRWSDSSKDKHDPENLQFLGEEREGIVLYCKERLQHEEIDYCVFGHRHTPVVHNLESSIYVNVGDWFLHRNYACFDGQQLTLNDYTPCTK